MATHPNPPPGMMFIEDTGQTPGIASHLGITPGTYRKWRMRGKGPRTFRLGKRIVAREAAVAEYIAELEQAAQLPRREMRPPEPRRRLRPQSATRLIDGAGR